MLSMKKMLVLVVAGATLGTASVAGANEKIEGKVLRTKLTACEPRANGGGCQGTLFLESTVDGKVQSVPIQVSMDTIIKRGKDYIFLPATQGSTVSVAYAMNKDQKAATTIDVITRKQ